MSNKKLNLDWMQQYVHYYEHDETNPWKSHEEFEKWMHDMYERELNKLVNELL